MPSVRSSVRAHRRTAIGALVVALALGLMWAGLQTALVRADEACYETPPGYLEQQVVSVRRTWWSVDCVMDPRNGDARYTVHRPWQSVRGIEEISGDPE